MEPGKDETMTEIEKMYKLANVKAIDIAEYGSTYIPKSIEIDGKLYPPFTAEKQLELIKWSARREPKVEIGYSSVCGYWVENQTDTRYYFGDQFDNALASLINNLWQDLTEEEYKQIKEILS